MEFKDEEDFSSVTPESMMGTKFVDTLKRRTRYSLAEKSAIGEAFVNFHNAPVISAEKPLTGYIFLMPHTVPECRIWLIRWILPEGWHAHGRSAVATNNRHWIAYETNGEDCTAEFTLTCDQKPDPINYLLLDLSATDRPTHITIPIVVLGE